ncbi:MAG: head GIN domain-containing protein [Burkholderiaceae bacterium]
MSRASTPGLPALALLLGAALAGPALAQAQVEAQVQRPEGRIYAPGAFDRLEISGSATITLRQGEHDQVFIAGDAQMQKSVEVELDERRLTIKPAGSWKFWTSSRLQIEVQMRQISQLTLSGASDLNAPGPIKADRLGISISGAGLARLDDLNAGQLRFDISGAGDGRLAGQAGELNLSVSGKGKLLAEQLKAARATVSISGVGNANVWVTDQLRVSISGIGSVDYWGQPELRRSTSGLGSVNARGDKR